VGYRKGSLKREVYNHEHPTRKLKRPQINNLIIHLKLLEKQEQQNPKSNRQKEIIIIRAEVNELETKKKKKKKKIIIKK
jgi:hypothetical protein